MLMIDDDNSLADLRKRSPEGKLGLRFSALCGKQMIRAIQDLHEKGVLHRDIKPGKSPFHTQNNQKIGLMIPV